MKWLHNVIKEQCHEIFCMQFFSSKHVSRPPDSYPKAVSNINSNSPRYSNSKLIPHCGPPRGFDPTVWPLPQDRILRCGHLCGIESYSVAPPAGSNPMVWPPPGGIESYGVAPPAGSTLLGFERDRDRDRTFRCGPSRGIGLSAVAPPTGSDFLLWPLPGDWTFRCGPSQGIGLSDVAPPGGSNPTMWPSPGDRLPYSEII
jgi:hypothetical protein